MDKKVTYHEQTDVENTLRLRDVLKTLPPFCRDFFRAIEPRTTTKTRISYAYDIRIFFQFLLEQNPVFKDWSMDAFTVDILDQITAIDLEEYEEYLKVYQAGDKTETNGERGLKRKMSSLRSFYAYYFKREMIHTNPTVLVDVPKSTRKASSCLEAEKLPCFLIISNTAAMTLPDRKRSTTRKPRTATSLSSLSCWEQVFVFRNVSVLTLRM